MNRWSRNTRAEVARALSAAFLDGEWTERGLLERGRAALGRRPRWLTRLVRDVLSYHSRRRPADQPRGLTALVERLLDSLNAEGSLGRPPPVRRAALVAAEMGPTRWPVPAVESVAELARFFDLHLGELEWLADRRGLERTVGAKKLRNYRYSWLVRPGAPPRVMERPKRLLKDVQRRVLHDVLDLIPPHEVAQGFRRGHSALTHARRHVGRRVVLRVDLEAFFASIAAGRIYGVFREAGYPEGVAHALTGLCTNVVPADAWARVPRPRAAGLLDEHYRLGRHLAAPHLPQGAPTSPALANLCAFGLDRRLAGLASSIGATYSRYADDLVLSGDAWLIARAADVRALVTEIAGDEGFRVNERKSQLMSRAGRQRVCGIVVNERPNASRSEFDRLKATLHDAARRGPAAANRRGVPDFRAHLLGRIAWVESLNPARGARLRRQFGEIEWNGAADAPKSG